VLCTELLSEVGKPVRAARYSYSDILKVFSDSTEVRWSLKKCWLKSLDRSIYKLVKLHIVSSRGFPELTICAMFMALRRSES
jgi:hypothetical protein